MVHRVRVAPLPKRLPLIALTALLAIAIMLPVVPAATGELGGVFNPTSVPVEYGRVNQLLEENLTTLSFYRTFWWPKFERFGAHTNRMPGVSGVDAVQGNLQFLLPDKTNLWSLFSNASTSAFFDLSAIRYVVIPYDAINDIYPVTEPQNLALLQVQNQSWLRRVDLSDAQTKIFVNSNARPYLYGSTLDIPSILSSANMTAVLGTTMNVSFSILDDGATLQVLGSQGIRSIIVAEGYDPGWAMRCDDGFTATPNNAFGLTGFPLPFGSSANCTVYYDSQPAVIAGAVVSAAGYASVPVLLVIEPYARKMKKRTPR